MKCPHCKEDNPPGSAKCAFCGESLASKAITTPKQRQKTTGGIGYLPNYLAQSILVMLFCCLPLGIVGLVFAAQVNGRVIAGEYERAMNASKLAKMWCWITFGVGIFFWVAYFSLYFIFFGLAILGGILGSM
jgi:Interferon-induced transmembrane protein